MGDQATDEFIGIQAVLAGRYSLQRELGRGGMGIVYLAHDVALERPVALKLLQPQLAGQPVLRQRFLTEARTAAKLSHPNIIPIHAVEQVGDLVFFVMAFVDGETLGERIRRKGPVPPSELARILREVGWGLAYAHAQGVLHRDVKADNIMLERGSGRALVVDFGIARVARPGGVTGAGEILGTPEYMSPEQANGEVADQRSDIYSLGVVAFYALSGRLPFEGANAGAVLAKLLTQPAPSLTASVQGLPAKLADAVDRCLAKDPAARFASAEELADVAGAALAARREAPLPVQMFTRKGTELTQNLVFVTYLQGALVFFGTLASLVPGGLGVNVLFGLAGISAVADPFLLVGMVGQIRALLKSGYTPEDVLAGWSRELQSDQEERAAEHGRTPGPLERISRWAFPLGVTASIVSTALHMPFAFWLDVAGWFGIFFGVAGLWRYDGRTALSRRLLGRFLRSRLGRWACGLAGIGLNRAALASLATHRPTELGIGMAVEALFEALPRETRTQLAELPSVVRRLEADATKMREQVESLNDAAAKAGRDLRRLPSQPGADALLDRRGDLERQLVEARDAARQRLADAVTALERIRLDLLRLTAGAGSVNSITLDLVEARALNGEVDRLLEAHTEVEAHLEHPTPV
jgi:eukaryotic-like serine/threonine-protein kinase